MMQVKRSIRSCAIVSSISIGCVSTPTSGTKQDTYLRWVSFEVPVNEHVLLRWREDQMPLRVFLTPPPPGLFADSESVYESVRDGVLDWSEVAGPGLPSFVFVDEIGEANIPIIWATEPDGDWYIAHCAYDIQPFSRRFGVARVLVTGRWSRDRVADLFDIYATVLHEMGHALGLGGHSPDRSDIMYPSASRTATEGLSARDRATLRELYSRPIGARISGAHGDR